MPIKRDITGPRVAQLLRFSAAKRERHRESLLNSDLDDQQPIPQGLFRPSDLITRYLRANAAQKNLQA